MGQYLPVFALLVLAVVFGVLSLLVSKVLAPRLPTRAKEAPYECGIIPGREPPERFPVRFYLVAMIFIVFDIEVIFFFPWAMVFERLGLFGLVAIAIFAAAVFESFVYLISNGALEWGPIKRQQRSALVSPARTAETTIRRVGLEGRPRAAEEAA
ncbi:MAG: NADH-quinone oxidoreductase subunit A [Acidimicrobiales bacterium]|nr:NADH-quinone oxidoreductase subunit A [Acidimicrobiales bacterium]